MSDSVRPHRWQPTRLPCPWDSPGKNTGVGCHFLLQCMKVKSESEVAQSCPTVCDPMDCSPPGSFVHGIFQARVLEWVAVAFSGIGKLKVEPWFTPGRENAPHSNYTLSVVCREKKLFFWTNSKDLNFQLNKRKGQVNNCATVLLMASLSNFNNKKKKKTINIIYIYITFYREIINFKSLWVKFNLNYLYV